ncbi:hypothetical protein [Actinoplanes sp. NPDC026623]|uniref:hypothetical protein n=1 Tax=Actinoplanes sp. NPDC026623 TaxID=3155610 RepID=UPI0033EF1B84
MTFLTASRGARSLALAAAGVVLLAVVLIWFRAPGEPRPAAVVSSAAPSARPGWQTIEYRGVQVDIPSAWERVDPSDCEFKQWALPGSSPCGRTEGVAFYGSALFDPAHGPGVRRDADGAGWGGYVYAGDYAVSASDTDREVVQRLLDSARVTAGRSPH